jgi:hypothetical protein
MKNDTKRGDKREELQPSRRGGIKEKNCNHLAASYQTTPKKPKSNNK